jgi:PRC-barrel domain
MRMSALFAGGALLLAASVAQAQAPAAPAEGMAGYRAKQVLGSKVNIQGNLAIGTVDDIVFSDAGNVEYLIVQNEGKLVTVPWEAAKFNFEQRTAVVNLTQDQFRLIPTYTVDRYPNFWTPAYQAETYKFYNLTPRIRIRDRKP